MRQVLDDLQVDAALGLTPAEAEARRAAYGYNELAKEPPTALWKLIMEQFDDTLVKVWAHAYHEILRTSRSYAPAALCIHVHWSYCYIIASIVWLNGAQILLGSAAVSFGLAFFDEASQHEGLRAYVEPLVIVLILVLNAAVGVWQESRSEAALEALKELQSEHARVIRDGRLVRAVIFCGPHGMRVLGPWHAQLALAGCFAGGGGCLPRMQAHVPCVLCVFCCL